ncbi:uncharacterized protein J8A68_001596 [[Candida] subhashii]|uniref:Uncharacterized protein n=1 Tax=[Candida] subhashii TaxID=561895 RepID=A0A8J5QFV0_9ASCO|nr:uncharacterized protein J8A68_001596 [[Candida] subhashii]KAG7664874.1 hypothetical protein J8A68_001596 [[Candida] subhashii]
MVSAFTGIDEPIQRGGTYYGEDVSVETDELWALIDVPEYSISSFMNSGLSFFHTNFRNLRFLYLAGDIQNYGNYHINTHHTLTDNLFYIGFLDNKNLFTLWTSSYFNSVVRFLRGLHNEKKIIHVVTDVNQYNKGRLDVLQSFKNTGVICVTNVKFFIAVDESSNSGGYVVLTDSILDLIQVSSWKSSVCFNSGHSTLVVNYPKILPVINLFQFGGGDCIEAMLDDPGNTDIDYQNSELRIVAKSFVVDGFKAKRAPQIYYRFHIGEFYDKSMFDVENTNYGVRVCYYLPGPNIPCPESCDSEIPDHIPPQDPVVVTSTEKEGPTVILTITTTDEHWTTITFTVEPSDTTTELTTETLEETTTEVPPSRAQSKHWKGQEISPETTPETTPGTKTETPEETTTVNPRVRQLSRQLSTPETTPETTPATAPETPSGTDPGSTQDTTSETTPDTTNETTTSTGQESTSEPSSVPSPVSSPDTSSVPSPEPTPVPSVDSSLVPSSVPSPIPSPMPSPEPSPESSSVSPTGSSTTPSPYPSRSTTETTQTTPTTRTPIATATTKTPLSTSTTSIIHTTDTTIPSFVTVTSGMASTDVTITTSAITVVPAVPFTSDDPNVNTHSTDGTRSTETIAVFVTPTTAHGQTPYVTTTAIHLDGTPPAGTAVVVPPSGNVRSDADTATDSNGQNVTVYFTITDSGNTAEPYIPTTVASQVTSTPGPIVGPIIPVAGGSAGLFSSISLANCLLALFSLILFS